MRRALRTALVGSLAFAVVAALVPLCPCPPAAGDPPDHGCCPAGFGLRAASTDCCPEAPETPATAVAGAGPAAAPWPAAVAVHVAPAVARPALAPPALSIPPPTILRI